MMQIDVKVCGIPCIAESGRVDIQPGNPRADSDWDFYGHKDVEFHLLDRKGYPAKWLERKLTDSERDDIETKLLKELKNASND